MEQTLSFVGKFLVVLVSIIAPIHATMLALGFLVVVDLVLGIWVARKSGVPITSAGLRRTLVKLVLFQVGLVTAFIVETYLAKGVFPIVQTFSAMVSISELVSVFENINKISGVNVLGKLIESLRSKNDSKNQDQ